MVELLPDRLKQLWHSVEEKKLSAEDFGKEQERLLGEYRDIWTRALLLEGMESLEESLLTELGRYVGCKDSSEVRSRCLAALANVKDEWHSKVSQGDRRSVECFYDESQAMMYELTWWHTLGEDNSPLGYVNALRFAQLHGCRRYLDYGSGVGSGGILFARNGYEATLADISTAMLAFSQWRSSLRGLSIRHVDVKQEKLPGGAFDMVTAMDVFEHLVDPVEVSEEIWRVLEPGGFLFGRFHSEVDEDRPQHIVQDFEPTLNKLKSLGFVEVWRDEWLWGHQVFQKPKSA